MRCSRADFLPRDFIFHLRNHSKVKWIIVADENPVEHILPSNQSRTHLHRQGTTPPQISLDFDNAPSGQGREKHHMAAVNAAKEAGVKQIIYTSLAFGGNSGAGVMRAHLRTEAYLKGLEEKGVVKVTVIREGLYNSSWPLYLG